VLIPSAVFGELTISRRDPSAVIDTVSMPWLIVAIAEDLNHVKELRKNLDAGEA
jgi:predicted nucleic acid-binding protein